MSRDHFVATLGVSLAPISSLFVGVIYTGLCPSLVDDSSVAYG